MPVFDRSIEIARAGGADHRGGDAVGHCRGQLAAAPGAGPGRPPAALRPDGVPRRARAGVRGAAAGARVGYGLDEAAIRARLEDNDLPNARRVIEGSVPADVWRGTSGEGAWTGGVSACGQMTKYLDIKEIDPWFEADGQVHAHRVRTGRSGVHTPQARYAAQSCTLGGIELRFVPASQGFRKERQAWHQRGAQLLFAKTDEAYFGSERRPAYFQMPMLWTGHRRPLAPLMRGLGSARKLRASGDDSQRRRHLKACCTSSRCCDVNEDGLILPGLRRVMSRRCRRNAGN